MKQDIAAALLALSLMTAPAHAAAVNCTLVMAYPAETMLAEYGDCATRRAPMSTFKMPLAVMGFDSGILTDAHAPLWPWPQDEPDVMDIHKRDADPALWMENSVVWYSQNLTRAMGMEKFSAYVDQFSYGNRDLSGPDALTQSWLMSTLKISPREQLDFLRRFMARELGVTDSAYDLTMAIMPSFAAGDWTVQGKTGSGWLLHADGTRDKNRTQGWFIGWARRGGETVLFVRLFIADGPVDGYGGPLARDKFLQELPALMAAHQK